MKENFDQIIEWHVDHFRETPIKLHDGMSSYEVKTKFEQINMNPPDELVNLYSITAGTHLQKGDIIDRYHFFPGFYLIHIERAIHYYKSFHLDPRWNEGWFPIFANGGGDFFVVDCNESLNDSKVIGFLLGESEHLIEFQSISLMLETIAECFSEGAYFLDAENYLEINDRLEAEIANRFNPGLERWESELV